MSVDMKIRQQELDIIDRNSLFVQSSKSLPIFRNMTVPMTDAVATKIAKIKCTRSSR